MKHSPRRAPPLRAGRRSAALLRPAPAHSEGCAPPKAQAPQRAPALASALAPLVCAVHLCLLYVPQPAACRPRVQERIPKAASPSHHPSKAAAPAEEEARG